MPCLVPCLIILLTPARLFGQDSNLLKPARSGINTNDDGIPKRGQQLHGIKFFLKPLIKKSDFFIKSWELNLPSDRNICVDVLKIDDPVKTSAPYPQSYVKIHEGKKVEACSINVTGKEQQMARPCINGLPAYNAVDRHTTNCQSISCVPYPAVWFSPIKVNGNPLTPFWDKRPWGTGSKRSRGCDATSRQVDRNHGWRFHP